MKGTLIISMIYLMSGSWTTTNVSTKNKSFTLVGTYLGLNDDDNFQFTNNEDAIIIFDLVADTLDIDLYDNDYIHQKFEIVWKFIDDSSSEDEEDEVIFDTEDDLFKLFRTEPNYQMKKMIVNMKIL